MDTAEWAQTLLWAYSRLSEDALEEFVGTSHFSRERLEAALFSDFPACFAEFLLCLTSPRTGGDIAPKQAHCKSTDLRMRIAGTKVSRNSAC